jgi:ankyrin repeat protein
MRRELTAQQQAAIKLLEQIRAKAKEIEQQEAAMPDSDAGGGAAAASSSSASSSAAGSSATESASIEDLIGKFLSLASQEQEEAGTSTQSEAEPIVEGQKERYSQLLFDLLVNRKLLSTLGAEESESFYSKAVSLLLAAGAAVNKADDDGCTPLHGAALIGHTKVVQALLEAGADLNAAQNNPFRLTPLCVAAGNGDEAVVRQLLLAGADTQAFMLNAVAYAYSHIIKFKDNIKDKKDNIKDKQDEIKNFLEHARFGNKGKVEEILSTENKKWLMNVKGNDGNTALSLAAASSQKDVVEYLLQQGADTVHFMNITRVAQNIKIRPYWEKIDLFYEEIKEGNMPHLLEGEEWLINVRDKDSVTPLLRAAKERFDKVVTILLERGADVNQAANSGWTPLCVAAANGDEAVVAALLGAGANANKAITDDGATALIMAAEQGDEAIAARLLAAGADMNKANKEGETPLYLAAENGYTETFQALLESGAVLTEGIYDEEIDDSWDADIAAELLTARKTAVAEYIKFLLGEDGAEGAAAEQVMSYEQLMQKARAIAPNAVRQGEVAGAEGGAAAAAANESFQFSLQDYYKLEMAKDSSRKEAILGKMLGYLLKDKFPEKDMSSLNAVADELNEGRADIIDIINFVLISVIGANPKNDKFYSLLGPQCAYLDEAPFSEERFDKPSSRDLASLLCVIPDFRSLFAEGQEAVSLQSSTKRARPVEPETSEASTITSLPEEIKRQIESYLPFYSALTKAGLGKARALAGQDPGGAL